MKKAESADPLDRKFTLAQLAGKGIRGKYHKRATMRTNLVKLDPEIARRFPSDKAVNDALASVIHLASLTVNKSPAASSARAKAARRA